MIKKIFSILGLLILLIFIGGRVNAQLIGDDEHVLSEDQQIEMLQHLLVLEDISEDLEKSGIIDSIAKDMLNDMTDLIHSYNFGEITLKLKRDMPGVQNKQRIRMEDHIYPTTGKLNIRLKNYILIEDIYSKFLDRQSFLLSVSGLFEFVQNEVSINSENKEVLTSEINRSFEEATEAYYLQKYDLASEMMKDVKGMLDYTALSYLWQGKQVITSLENKGIGVKYLNDKYGSAEEEVSMVYFDNVLNIDDLDEEFRLFVQETSKGAVKGFLDEYTSVDYMTIKAIITEINYTAEQIIRIENRFEEVGAKLLVYKEGGMDTVSSESYLLSGRNSFEDERYDEAEAFISKANAGIALELTKLAVTDVVAKEGMGYIKRNKVKLTVILVFLIIFGPIITRKIRWNIIDGKLKNKQLERKILFDLTKKAQMDRFRYGTVDDDTYNIKLDKYMEGISHIKSVIPVLEDMALRLKEKTNIERFLINLKEKILSVGLIKKISEINFREKIKKPVKKSKKKVNSSFKRKILKLKSIIKRGRK